MTSLLGALVARSPVPLTQSWRPSFPTFGRGHSAAYLRSMESVGTLFAIVNRTAESVSQVEWKLYRKRTDARRVYTYEGANERVEVMDHQALRVWNRPNPFMTRQEFVEIFSQHLDLVGEGWWLAGRDPRATFPLELWPVRPDRMAPIEHPTEYITGYEYRTPDGGTQRLELDEVIFLRRPNPNDSYRGIGPVQSVMSELDANRYSSEWNRNFFLNSAEPGGIIKTDGRLSDQQFDELRTRWNEGHKGVNNAHRVAILEGHEWIDRKYTQRDMQFAELSALSSEKIREAFAFPKPMLGTVEDVNRANADAAEVVFARWLLKPRLERIKQALNNDFLPMFGTAGQGVEFDYCSPVPEDQDAENAELSAKADFVSKLVAAGFDPAAVVQAAGLPDIAFGSAPATAPAARASIDNAQRWVAKANRDEDTCAPCLRNDGHLYRNRADAYADYPEGSNYVNCVGERYGNDCRCTVVKRGRE